MLFHNVLCASFLALLAPKIETNAQLNSGSEKPEALFADVIKNISRVNNELQVLINNYEQLKKTQNSLENFDDKEEYISDAEGGRVNRNSKNYVGNKRGTSDKTYTTLKFQTQMIYVEDESEKSNEPKKSIETEKSSQSQHSKEVETSQEVESRKPIETTGKKKLNVKKNTTKASIANEEPIAPKEETEPEIQEFLDTPKKMTSKTNRKKRVTPEEAVEHEREREKTKYFEKETLTKYLNLNSSGSDSSIEGEQHTEEREKTKYFEKETLTKYLNLNSSGSDSSIEGEQHTEEEVVAFHPKERAYEKDTDDIQVTAAIILRSQTNESKTTKKVNKNLSLELSDDDEALSKDLFKTSVLRQAYGDACLKLVVRKCHRACKSAFKSSCQAVTCKSEMKKFFDKTSRIECIDAFNASSKGNDYYSLRRIITPITLNGGVMTREEYFSVACQTQMKMPTRRMSNDTTIQNGEQLNILRDKYEKACQKISQNKCGKGCNSAQKATCAKYRCNKRLKKNFKKYCRSDCKIAYSNKDKKSSNSDDSNTDSDSDDDDSDDDVDDDDDDDDKS